MTLPATLTPLGEPFMVAVPATYVSTCGPGAFRSSVITTGFAGLAEVLVTCTRYSTVAPGTAGPPPTTVTCLVMVNAGATTVTVCASWQSSTPGVPLVSVQV